MKTWTTPAIAELGVEETANGFWKVGWEGPLNIIFGAKKSEEKQDPSTTEDPIKPTSGTNPTPSETLLS